MERLFKIIRKASFLSFLAAEKAVVFKMLFYSITAAVFLPAEFYSDLLASIVSFTPVCKKSTIFFEKSLDKQKNRTIMQVVPKKKGIRKKQ